MAALKRKPVGLAAAFFLTCSLLLLLAGCACGEKVLKGEKKIGRQLRVFDSFPLHQKLTIAIVNGDIDRAAELLYNAVKLGDGSSIVLGFLHARASPGNEFSIVQTIIRALHMGLDRDDLENTIKVGSTNQPGGQEVVQEITVILEDTNPPVATPPPAPSVHYFQSSGPTTFVYGATTDQIAYHPTESLLPPAVPSYLAPVHSGFTVMVDPVVSSTISVEPETVRACRGEKEEQCCKEYNSFSPGCSCDVNNNCRFKFIHENPVFVQDTRRPGDDIWVCYCQFD